MSKLNLQLLEDLRAADEVWVASVWYEDYSRLAQATAWQNLLLTLCSDALLVIIAILAHAREIICFARD